MTKKQSVYVGDTNCVWLDQQKKQLFCRSGSYSVYSRTSQIILHVHARTALRDELICWNKTNCSLFLFDCISTVWVAESSVALSEVHGYARTPLQHRATFRKCAILHFPIGTTHSSYCCSIKRSGSILKHSFFCVWCFFFYSQKYIYSTSDIFSWSWFSNKPLKQYGTFALKPLNKYVCVRFVHFCWN